MFSCAYGGKKKLPEDRTTATMKSKPYGACVSIFYTQPLLSKFLNQNHKAAFPFVSHIYPLYLHSIVSLSPLQDLNTMSLCPHTGLLCSCLWYQRVGSPEPCGPFQHPSYVVLVIVDWIMKIILLLKYLLEIILLMLRFVLGSEIIFGRVHKSHKYISIIH